MHEILLKVIFVLLVAFYKTVPWAKCSWRMLAQEPFAYWDIDIIILECVRNIYRVSSQCCENEHIFLWTKIYVLRTKSRKLTFLNLQTSCSYGCRSIYSVPVSLRFVYSDGKQSKKKGSVGKHSQIHDFITVLTNASLRHHCGGKKSRMFVFTNIVDFVCWPSPEMALVLCVLFFTPLASFTPLADNSCVWN